MVEFSTLPDYSFCITLQNLKYGNYSFSLKCTKHVLLENKISSACFIAVQVYRDTGVKYLIDSVHCLSRLAKKDSHN